MSTKHSKSTDPCAGRDRTPRRPDNPPGLGQIDYTIGTRAEFLDRMRYGAPRHRTNDPISGAVRAPLAGLATDLPEDPANAILESFAASLDVLSFYSERVANAGYLGTAVRRDRVMRLAETIGYVPAPGVAASVYLAFQVSTADNPYRVVDLDTGIQAVSIPQEKDDLPQTYETTEPITARAEWNAIPARSTRPQFLALYSNASDASDGRNGTIYAFDLDQSFGTEALDEPDIMELATAASLAPFHPLDANLDLAAALESRIAEKEINPSISAVLHALPVDEVHVEGVGLGLTRGMRVVAVGQAVGGKVYARPFRIAEIRELKPFGQTALVLSEGGEPPKKVRRAPFIYRPLLTYGVIPAAPKPLDTVTLQKDVKGKAWTGTGLSALVATQAWDRTEVMNLFALIPGIVLRKPELAPPVPLGLVALRESSGAFGNAAPLWDTVKFGEDDNGKPDKGPFTVNWDNPKWVNTIWTNSQNKARTGEAQIFLEREIKDIQPGGWVVLETPSGGSLPFQIRTAATESLADFAITGKATGIGLSNPDGTKVTPPGAFEDSSLNAFKTRSTQVHSVSQPLTLGGIPLEDSLPAGTTTLDLDGLYLDFERGRPVSITGARADAEGLAGSETHLIAEVLHIDGMTRLLLESELSNSYVRTQLRICGNLAAATHGALVEEAIGSGDASVPGQAFALGQKHLTHVSSTNASGVEDTLEIRVDGLLWSRVPTLANAGPSEGVYTLSIADDGSAVVGFGDGTKGRRLPTGDRNVEARYRVGIGLDGHQPAGAIAQLRTKPLGLDAVVNPAPATGASDPDTKDVIRDAAPGSVRTLGRAVSLTDYADYALGFAGVGKARAASVWAGTEKAIHLTIAPKEPVPLDAAAPLVVNLAAALEIDRAPGQPLIVAPYSPVYFSLTARLSADPAYRTADVADAARAALEQDFGFAARRLAQPVSAAEVIAVLHNVAGVVSVRLDSLARIVDGAPAAAEGVTPDMVLPAFAAQGPPPGKTGLPTRAELLILQPGAALMTVETTDV